MTIKLPHQLILTVLLLSLAGLLGITGARAQAGRTVRISVPEVEDYPEITVYIDPVDRDGTSLQGLSSEQVNLTEDGIQREIIEFQERQPGLQLVVAFNMSQPFSIQDENGQSRFDFIKRSLLNWAAQPLESSPDDLSLVANNGLDIAHLESRDQWIAALEEFDPDLQDIESDFSVLARAIDIASDPIEQPGMKQVVLFFSAQPATADYPALSSLSAQAADNQVQIYNILVSSPAFFETEGASQFQNLSQQTGGTFLTFSGEKPLADLGQLFAPLRSTYQLRYRTSIVTSGSHTLEVSVSSSPSDIVGQREFSLEVQPPNPIFISPPRIISRQLETNSQSDIDLQDFQPDSYSLPILVEFPDGHPRELEELIFRVDGEIMGRISEPPYQQVSWDLSNYQSSGTHYLTLEAVDIMGLSKMSLATPIDIQIELPPQSLRNIISRNAPALAVLAFILLLGMTLFILISRGTIQPTDQNRMTWILDQGRRTAGMVRKILSQQSSIKDDQPQTFFQPYRLIPINDISRQLFTEPVHVHQQNIILGKKEGKDQIRIEHPSVNAEHTRITIRGDGRYQITDLGATAGTWINYQQLSGAKNHFIIDGDMIHIGEAAFRFQTVSTMPSIEEKNRDTE